MVDDLLITRQQIEERKERLRSLRVPVITRRMLQLGIKSRQKRQEIGRYKKEILGQRAAYEKQLIGIDEYLEELKRKKEAGNGIEEQPILLEPKISFFDFPKLKKVRSIGRIRWL